MSKTVRSPATRPGVRQVLLFNATLAAFVWLGWSLLGRQEAFWSIQHYWKISLTMIAGSLVGGGTSEGGAAVAFPVFTKVFHIPPADARLFSFAIQSIGMGAATLSILFQRIAIEKRTLSWAAPGGILGMLASTYLLVPVVPAAMVRIFFTAIVTSLALVLLSPVCRRAAVRHDSVSIFGRREKAVLFCAGLLGGSLSGLIGTGENIVVFMVLVILFRVNERVATPTSVVLMWLVTLPAFLLHWLVLHDIPTHVFHYWLAAVPIVVVGAPLGALLCSRMSRQTIVAILVSLISLELVSTLALIRLSTGVASMGAATLVFFLLTNFFMSRSRRYAESHGLRSLPET